MRFLQNLRLDATHRELLAAEPGERTVTDVAFARGISHLGRFAGAYRERFGECPSETLGRRH
jgi:transcriptional regulator GlxA family with amidase domain